MPLAHNYYYGNSFTLITDYGSKILSLDNILAKDQDFYFDKLISFTTLFAVISLIIPIKNLYIKTIILSQYLTLFYFDENLRYFWLYWIMVIQITLSYIINIYTYRKKING